MRGETYGSVVVPLGVDTKVTYSLLREELGRSSPLGCEIYGIRIDMGDETAVRTRLTASRSAAGALLEKLVEGCVTPVALNDVVDDWLLE